MTDLPIWNGAIVHGSQRPRSTGCASVKAGRIVAHGQADEPARHSLGLSYCAEAIGIDHDLEDGVEIVDDGVHTDTLYEAIRSRGGTLTLPIDALPGGMESV